MQQPVISEAHIRQYASSQSFQRGMDYYRSGAVLSVERRGNQLWAEVEGSSYMPYQVWVTFDEAGLIEAVCDCPYDWGGYCKHIVAVLLVYLHSPEDIETRPTIEALLANIQADQLRQILVALVERQPSLADVVEGLILPQESVGEEEAGESGHPRQRHTPLDPDPFRRQAHGIIHSLDKMRPSEAYWQVGEVIKRLGEILSQAETFVQAGDGRNALVILEALTEEYVKGWMILDDSSGEPSGFFGALGNAWTEAILTADLSQEECTSWADRLTDWQGNIEAYGVSEGFDAAIGAAIQGWDYPPLLRVLGGDISSKGAWEDEAPWFADDLAVARLNVLERQGRWHEYLYLAEAEGQLCLYLTMLVKLDRIPQAVDEGLKYLATQVDALAIARILREKNEIEAALRIAEHGLTLQGYRTMDLARWLRDTAGGVGRQELALKAAEVAFDESCTMVDYLAVQALTGERWPEYRTRLLKRLEEVTYAQDKIEIYLHEGMLQEAMKVVVGGDYVGYGWVEQVVEKAGLSHPEWAIRQCKQQAERIMDAGQSKYYDNAVEWLRRAREIYQATGRSGEWGQYLDSVLAKHFRKYSLVPKLKLLG